MLASGYCTSVDITFPSSQKVLLESAALTEILNMSTLHRTLMENWDRELIKIKMYLRTNIQLRE